MIQSKSSAAPVRLDPLSSREGKSSPIDSRKGNAVKRSSITLIARTLLFAAVVLLAGNRKGYAQEADIAVLDGDRLTLDALLLKPDGSGEIRARETRAIGDVELIGTEIGNELRRRAGAEYGFA
jgi:hypothetical protein